MKVTVLHSSVWPEQVLAGHSSAEVKSMLLPEAKPCLRQSASAAARQSGAPFGALAQRSSPAHHAGGRQLGDGVHRVLGGIGRALADFGGALTNLGGLSENVLAVGGGVVAEIVHLALGAAQVIPEAAGALIEEAADRFEHAGLLRWCRGAHHRRRRVLGQRLARPAARTRTRPAVTAAMQRCRTSIMSKNHAWR